MSQAVRDAEAELAAHSPTWLPGPNASPGVGIGFPTPWGWFCSPSRPSISWPPYFRGWPGTPWPRAQRTVYRLRREVDQKLARLPLKYFDTHQRGETTLSRVTNDIDNIVRQRRLQAAAYTQHADHICVATDDRVPNDVDACCVTASC